MPAVLPTTDTYLYYPYQCDILDANGDALIGQIKAICDPTALTLGGSQNIIPSGDISLPYPLTTSKKRRGILPRHVVLAVTPSTKTKASIVKIPILSASVAEAILLFNEVLAADFFEYAGFTGQIVIQNYVQESYFRVYETPQETTPGLANAIAAVPSIDPDAPTAPGFYQSQPRRDARRRIE